MVGDHQSSPDPLWKLNGHQMYYYYASKICLAFCYPSWLSDFVTSQRVFTELTVTQLFLITLTMALFTRLTTLEHVLKNNCCVKI